MVVVAADIVVVALLGISVAAEVPGIGVASRVAGIHREVMADLDRSEVPAVLIPSAAEAPLVMPLVALGIAAAAGIWAPVEGMAVAVDVLGTWELANL